MQLFPKIEAPRLAAGEMGVLAVGGRADDAEYEFRSVEKITVDLGGSMIEVTPTSDIQIEAIQTALVVGR